MVSDLLTDPEQLRKRLKALQEELQEHKGCSSEKVSAAIEALAEGSFRLAVHPSTSLSESLTLLHRAFRLDGTNPKHAYHIARLYFAHGMFEPASSWLQLAVRLCPTSHRIWAHVSLLQRELNAVYHGDDRYEPNALLERSDAISDAVSRGQDNIDRGLMNFKPPRSLARREQEQRKRGAAQAVTLLSHDEAAEQGHTEKRIIRRLLNPGQCRWSGIHDLKIESLLEGQPIKRRLEGLKPLLEKAAGAAAQRHGGASAFAILAIQWMVCGYPVEIVRKIRKNSLKDLDGPSMELLDRVCALYEADEGKLPNLLAHALEENEIPPLVAASIHQRRLLLRYPASPSFERFRSTVLRIVATVVDAQRFLETVSPAVSIDERAREAQFKEANDHARKLETAAAHLASPPPEPLYDAVADASDGPVDGDTVRQYRMGDAAVAQEQSGVDAVLAAEDRINQLGLEAEETRKWLEERWPELKQLTEAQRAGSLTEEQGSAAMAIARYVEEARYACDQGLQEVAAIRSAGDLSPEALPHLDQVEKQYQSLGGKLGKFRGKLAKLPNEPLVGLARLRHAVDEAERQLAHKFQEAHATFGAYSLRARHLLPIHALRATMQALEAEAFFRLGWRRTARRIWNAMLREDRLNANVLKNIAVCDMTSQDAVAALSSWRAYVELLYMHDVIAGTPRLHAERRADFHRSFGGAYAPSMLNQELGTNYKAWEDWKEGIDEASFQAFLASPGRVRSFVDHKLLEFLNRKLDFRSPLRVLGVTRSEGLRVRSGAMSTGGEEDAELREEATPEVVQKLIHFARDACAPLPDRIRDAFVLSCEQFLREAALACASPRQISAERDPHYEDKESRQTQWLGDICELKIKLHTLIRKISVGEHISSVDFMTELARLDTIPLDMSPVTLESVAKTRGIADTNDLMQLMRGTCQEVAYNLLKFIFDEDNKAEKAVRERQYQRLIREWARHPAMNPHLDLIDDPQPFYPESIAQAFRSEQYERGAIEVLRRWHQRYPELTGPARLLAQLLIRAGKCEEAIAVMDRACENAFHKEKLGECYYIRMQAWYAHGMDCFKAERYAEAIGVIERARDDAERVIERCDDSKTRDEAWEVYERGVSDIAFLYIRMGRFEKAVAAMDNACKGTERRETLAKYAFVRMQAWQGLANQAAEDENLFEYKRCLRKAREDSRRVIEDSHDEDEKRTARECLAQIDRILGH